MTLFQKGHILEQIEAFGEDVSTPVASVFKNVLFDVDEDDEVFGYE